MLDAIDDDSLTWHEAIGSAHTRLPPPISADETEAERPRVDALLARHDWELSEQSQHREALAGALDFASGARSPAVGRAARHLCRGSER